MPTTTRILPPIGAKVHVTTSDGYEAAGKLIGLMRDQDGPKVRVLGADGLERRVPLPAIVTPVG